MDIKSKAREFAIKAHANQVRKSEPDKPMIIHPIAVLINVMNNMIKKAFEISDEDVKKEPSYKLD